jgi:threonine dehydrogenase-like Zn-dependent dehydrogenase
MQAVSLQARRVTVEDVPTPTLTSPTDAIVRVTTTAICGTDVLAFMGRTQHVPGGAGHEVVGVIEEAGPGVERVKVGQRVVSPFSIHCGGCFYCKKGLLSTCERRQVYGLDLPGAQSEYVLVPNADAVLEPLPDDLPDEKAIFLSDLLTGVYAGLQTAGAKAGESICVVGAGPTGLATVLMARTLGAGRVFAVDPHDYRLEAAAKLGAETLNARADVLAALREATEGRGVDIAVEAVGKAAALAQAATYVRPWGTLLALGFGIEPEARFPVGRLAARRVRMLPAYEPAVKNYMAPVLQMLRRGVIDPTPLISHTLPLSEAPRGYEMMAKRTDGALKVLLKPGLTPVPAATLEPSPV